MPPNPKFGYLFHFVAHISSKGQIISEGSLGILKFSQKSNERIHCRGKNEFVRSFLGKTRADQKSFQNYLSFSQYVNQVLIMMMVEMIRPFNFEIFVLSMTIFFIISLKSLSIRNSDVTSKRFWPHCIKSLSRWQRNLSRKSPQFSGED